MSPASTVQIRRDGAIATITLHRPEKLNVLSPVEHHALQSILAELRTDFDTRVVLLTGSGRAFSAGADLANKREAGRPKSDLERRHRARIGDRTVAAIDALDQITIAVINGLCVGGGAVLALACDLRVIASDAWISIPEVEIGMPLTWGAMPLLVREIGPSRTLELVTTCDRIAADEALRLRLVNHVARHPMDKACELAEKIVAKPALPVALSKAQIRALRSGAAQGDTTFADGELYWIGVKQGGMNAQPPAKRAPARASTGGSTPASTRPSPPAPPPASSRKPPRRLRNLREDS